MTYPATPTFWIEPAHSAIVGLRRYHSSSDGDSPCPAGGYHNAITDLGVAPCELRDTEHGRTWPRPDFEYPARDDPRWPDTCAACDYRFTDADTRQDWSEPMYRRADTGTTTTLRRTEPGAMWDAFWLPFMAGPDGITLTVKCPNGHDWIVDSRASNCTMPDDNLHKCWIRHGNPRTEPVTVDKNGPTCAAGGGSIVAGDYHGFLTAGAFTAG